MEKKIEFEELDYETQYKIVETLLCFDKCHVEHAYGYMSVTANYCLCASYPKDYWISQDFNRSDFDFDGFDYNTAWFNVTNVWDYMTEEQKTATRNKFDKMADLFIELVIQKYLLKKKNK